MTCRLILIHSEVACNNNEVPFTHKAGRRTVDADDSAAPFAFYDIGLKAAAVVDIVLSDTKKYTGFVPQESFTLDEITSNRFGKLYKKR